ncbi:MAG: ABC transporter substrate-binding protein [Promethearchaeota archaeon]
MKSIKFQITIVFILVMPYSFIFINQYLNYNNVDAISGNTEPILSDTVVGNYTVPGVSGPIPPNQILKIGLLDDMNDITGDHAWKGAILAAREINEAGGIIINATTYYVGLVAEDTEEADPNLVTYIGVAAAQKMVNVHNPQFITGGFRPESLLAYHEEIMDAKIPFICTGCASDIFCENVLTNYARYKYFFRCMPMNGTSLVKELLTYNLALFSVLNATYGTDSKEVNKIGILREDLAWAVPIATALNIYLPSFGYSVVSDIVFPVTSTAADMTTYLTTLEALDAQVVIPLITSPAGILMSQVYEALKPGFIFSGINTYAQRNAHWDQTYGACRYEILMQSIHNTSKTPLTIPFWNNFIGEYGNEPYYTGVGSYDAVRLLVNASVETQSFNADTIVTSLEKINTSNSFIGVAAKIAFTNSHDLREGWPYASSLFCQWQMDGNKVVLPSWNQIYPDSLATGYLSIPYWGINNLVDDFSHELPGGFSLISGADDPDVDGEFILNWTLSDGADYYSVFQSDVPKPYVSKTHILLANQTSPGNILVSGLKTGEYNFFVVAYNETGQTFSNNVQVTVELPGPGNFTLWSDADDPDPNGAFDLFWTDSNGADNYSVYEYNKFITEINGSLTVHAFQTALYPFPISGLFNGDYYYVVVAYNGTGQTMSNCFKVTVQLPSPGDFVLTSDAGTPDTNGIFYLSWGDSDGADNYTIYEYTSPIIEINGSLTEIAFQTAVSPYLIVKYSNGEFHYIVVAYNASGYTLSNDIPVTIQISGADDGVGDEIIPGYDVLWILSILSFLSLVLIRSSLKSKK